ncbi:GNAT family N-acetyltransferase [Liquorilactobacillus hordei]|uniref:GNAT family N-acetyltransferase n=2 Tax=Liquorilactobacillus hordei TaxID=468911 RepID=A0A3Q8CYI2_9LACO|nr:GNAT family N-acetyltransferase [Liquorilactobacillus hordei]AUJ29688.1 GNAT family N-acetyltransferase [Liquorilactobacillus hordei]
MKTDIYRTCPIIENSNFLLRRTTLNDKEDLLKVYSDKMSVPFFNSDNCDGDDFFYDTLSRMEKAINYWNEEYKLNGFVRFSILNKKNNEAIGTFEIFKRVSKVDKFNNFLILRLDLRSDFEKSQIVLELLKIIIEPLVKIFACSKIASKVIPENTERRKAFQNYGFIQSYSPLIGDNDQKYFNYFVLPTN